MSNMTRVLNTRVQQSIADSDSIIHVLKQPVDPAVCCTLP